MVPFNPRKGEQHQACRPSRSRQAVARSNGSATTQRVCRAAAGDWQVVAACCPTCRAHVDPLPPVGAATGTTPLHSAAATCTTRSLGSKFRIRFRINYVIYRGYWSRKGSHFAVSANYFMRSGDRNTCSRSVLRKSRQSRAASFEGRTRPSVCEDRHVLPDERLDGHGRGAR